MLLYPIEGIFIDSYCHNLLIRLIKMVLSKDRGCKFDVGILIKNDLTMDYLRVELCLKMIAFQSELRMADEYRSNKSI